MTYTYTDVDSAMAALSDMEDDVRADYGGEGGEELLDGGGYSDLVRSLVRDCDPETAKELRRITGVGW